MAARLSWASRRQQLVLAHNAPQGLGPQSFHALMVTPSVPRPEWKPRRDPQTLRPALELSLLIWLQLPPSGSTVSSLPALFLGGVGVLVSGVDRQNHLAPSMKPEHLPDWPGGAGAGLTRAGLSCACLGLFAYLIDF